MIRTLDEILERAEERKKWQALDEFLEKSEEKRKWQEFDAFCLKLLPVPLEPLTPKEAEEQQREWEEMLAAAKAKFTYKPECIYIPPDRFQFEYLPAEKLWEEMPAAAKAKATSKDEFLLPVSGHECWGISPKLENLNLTGAAGGIGSEEK